MRTTFNQLFSQVVWNAWVQTVVYHVECKLLGMVHYVVDDDILFGNLRYNSVLLGAHLRKLTVDGSWTREISSWQEDKSESRRNLSALHVCEIVARRRLCCSQVARLVLG